METTWAKLKAAGAKLQLIRLSRRTTCVIRATTVDLDLTTVIDGELVKAFSW